MRKLKHMLKYRILLAFCIIAAIVAIAEVCFVYAKYYSQSERAGIAIASGIYFTSNYAVEAEDEEFFESIVTSDYQGGNYSFEFEIRNYENNLLFNGSDVDIPYTVSFWLGDSGVGAVYKVTWEDGSGQIEKGENNKITIEGESISGGAAKANSYTISIDAIQPPHIAVPIYVEVSTTEGSVVNKVLRGKMVLNNAERAESFIESQQFIVPNDTDDAAEKFAQIQKLSEFTYEIKTVGEVVATDEVTEELKLSWNPAVLDIDLFGEAYLEWINTSKETAPKTDENGWKYIIVKVMPYSSETIGFFRGADFETIVTDMEALNAAIVAEKYTAE